LYDKIHKNLTENKPYHRRLVNRRIATVEPVFGTLINFYNLKRLNTRGIAQANKHVLMAALCYNLKKYMKFTRKKPKIQAQAISKVAEMLFSLKNDFYSSF